MKSWLQESGHLQSICSSQSHRAATVRKASWRSPNPIPLCKARSPTGGRIKCIRFWIISKDWESTTTHTVGKWFLMFKWKHLIEYVFRKDLFVQDTLKFARIITWKLYQIVSFYVKLVTWNRKKSIKLVTLSFFNCDISYHRIIELFGLQETLKIT